MNRVFRVVVALSGLLAAPVWAQAPAPRTPTPATTPVPAPASAPSATPAPAAPTPSASASRRRAPAMAPGTKLDINSATAEQLDALPQIGPVRSKAIVAGRPYTDLQDLVTKKVLSQGVFDKAKGGMALANINTSSAADLAKTLPGIGEVRSKEIVAGRPYANPQDLVTKNVLTQAVFDKIKDVVAW